MSQPSGRSRPAGSKSGREAGVPLAALDDMLLQALFYLIGVMVPVVSIVISGHIHPVNKKSA